MRGLLCLQVYNLCLALSTSSHASDAGPYSAAVWCSQYSWSAFLPRPNSNAMHIARTRPSARRKDEDASLAFVAVSTSTRLYWLYSPLNFKVLDTTVLHSFYSTQLQSTLLHAVLHAASLRRLCFGRGRSRVRPEPVWPGDHWQADLLGARLA